MRRVFCLEKGVEMHIKAVFRSLEAEGGGVRLSYILGELPFPGILGGVILHIGSSRLC